MALDETVGALVVFVSLLGGAEGFCATEGDWLGTPPLVVVVLVGTGTGVSLLRDTALLLWNENSHGIFFTL
jgi:hypothetical protein